MGTLDGRALSKRLNKALKYRALDLERPPGLAVVLVGSDPASEVYVRRKGVVAGRIGFVHRQVNLDAEVSQHEVHRVIDELNADAAIDGILIQLPLPAHLDQHAAVERIQVDKDVDGLTTQSIGRLAQGRAGLVACTPKGVMQLLGASGVELTGANAVVMGRSNIVGRPMAMLLEQANATVTVCHSRTRDLPAILSTADVVVAAVGRAEMVQGRWLKPGAVVVDVGINRLEDGSLVGDVDFASCLPVASAVTPVPGGVGPMTIAMLMQNTYEAALKRQNG